MSYPVAQTQCSSCPFRETGWTEVRDFLMNRALNEASPICHSTGPEALTKCRSEEPLICRGARLFQAEIFYRLGFLDAPTIEAWEKRAQQCFASNPDALAE